MLFDFLDIERERVCGQTYSDRYIDCELTKEVQELAIDHQPRPIPAMAISLFSPPPVTLSSNKQIANKRIVS